MAASTSAAGISQDLARERAAHLVDLRYRLHCTIGARANVLAGREEIRFRLTKALDGASLRLDWRPDLGSDEIARTVQSLRINGHRHAGGRFLCGHLQIPALALVQGENRIELEFKAPIRAAGTALTRYRDAADGTLYVYSLFVPADASTVFPCFDQPDLKGRFCLTLTVPASWHAVSNAPIASNRAARRKRTVAFDETEPISTYAFAFSAGPLVAEGPISEGTTQLFVRQSQRHRAQRHARAILGLNETAVRYCTRYFGHPFPFRKYDLVLIPEFPYRGMEHAGATFLNEDSVLLGPSPGVSERLQRAQLIFHETAHQWMGDLVTMRWFDDLWIKEGFANFIAYRLAKRAISAPLARLAFHDAKVGAYEADRTRGATALHHAVADLTQAKSAYNTIVYAKAPAVLRMLEHALGARVFRSGIRRLVKAHAYGAVDWRALIGALEHASQRALERWAKTWLLRPGARSSSAPYAGMAAHAYVLPNPDQAGVAQAIRSLARARDTLRRHHLWEYLWAAVRNCVLDPKRFIALALARGRLEDNALIVARLAERLRIAIARLLNADEWQSLVPAAESLAWTAYRSSRQRDLRLAWMRASIGLARTAAGQARLRTLLARQPLTLSFSDRLAIAAAPVASGRESVPSVAKQLMLDPGSKARALAMYCLHAARPDGNQKRKMFDRWLEEPALPEHLIDAALPYFNHPDHARLTLPLLSRALDALPMLLHSRKIFFVNRWLAAFIGGQCSADAVGIVRRFLRRPDLAQDLRLKVLESSHALERDVAVYGYWHS